MIRVVYRFNREFSGFIGFSGPRLFQGRGSGVPGSGEVSEPWFRIKCWAKGFKCFAAMGFRIERRA